MRIQRILIPLLFFITSYNCVAQNMSAVESLQKQLKEAKADSTIIILKCKLAFEIVEADRDKAKAYVTEAEKLISKTGYQKGKMMAVYAKGMIYDYEAKFDSSIASFERSIQIAKEINEITWEAEGYISIGLEYIHQSKFDKAIEYYNKAETLADQINNPSLLAKAYRKKANLAMQSQQNPQGIEYIKKAIAVYEQLKDSAALGESFGSLGWAYKVEKKYDSTIFYLNKAIVVFKAKRYITFVPVAYTEIGKAFYEQAKYKEAITNYKEAAAIYDTVNYEPHQDALYIDFGDAYLKLGQYGDAESNYQKGWEMALKAKDLETQSDALYGLYNTKKALKDYAGGMRYFEQYDSVRNVLLENEQLAIVAEVQEKYESAKKEKQIQEQQFEIKQRNYWIIGIGGLLLLGGLLGYSNYRRSQLKQQAQLQTEIMKQQDLATKAVIEAEERERKRIAGELHDGVGQMMSAAKMNLSAIKSNLAFTSNDQENNFDKVVSLIDESCQEVRTVSHNMMPNALLKAGLAAAVREFIDKIDEHVIKINLYTEGLNQRIDGNAETVLYRVVQECVNNVIKHASANILDISLIKDIDGISATIEDNGKGFDTLDTAKFEGIGLKNIKSRIDFLKGSIEWNSAPGSGTLVAIHIPL
ncbi:ATP-binding protein [soil metagenome]